MIDCISVENMRISDAQTIANHVPSLELMHRAAYGVFLAHEWQSPVAIVVGSGNNGGDGFALACILKENHTDCTIFAVSQKMSDDSAYYASKAAEAGIAICDFKPGCLHRYLTIVDCLLGTGFRGEVRENYRSAIAEINTADAYVISVDINSGMNGDSGEAELAVYSDLTVTIGFIKNGLVTQNAGQYMKRLVCADIGIRLAKKENTICSEEEWHEKGGENGFYRCPHWLDMDVIRAFDVTD